MSHKPILRTERLTLTLFDPNSQENCDGVKKLFIYTNDKLMNHPDPAGKAETDLLWVKTLGHLDPSLYSKPEFQHLAGDVRYVVRLGHDDPAGSIIGYSSIVQRCSVPDHGWVIALEHQRRGYAAEANRELMRYMLEDLGITKLMAAMSVQNESSKRLAARIGYMPVEQTMMTVEGMVLQICVAPGVPAPPEGEVFVIRPGPDWRPSRKE